MRVLKIAECNRSIKLYEDTSHGAYAEVWKARAGTIPMYQRISMTPEEHDAWMEELKAAKAAAEEAAAKVAIDEPQEKSS